MCSLALLKSNFFQFTCSKNLNKTSVIQKKTVTLLPVIIVI